MQISSCGRRIGRGGRWDEACLRLGTLSAEHTAFSRTTAAAVEGMESHSPQGTVESDLRCVNCGYNLRTLAWDAVCTECGKPVALSAAPAGFYFTAARDIKPIRWAIAMWSASAVAYAI